MGSKEVETTCPYGMSSEGCPFHKTPCMQTTTVWRGVVCDAAAGEADTPERHQLITPPLHLGMDWVLSEVVGVCMGLTAEKVQLSWKRQPK